MTELAHKASWPVLLECKLSLAQPRWPIGFRISSLALQHNSHGHSISLHNWPLNKCSPFRIAARMHKREWIIFWSAWCSTSFQAKNQPGSDMLVDGRLRRHEELIRAFILYSCPVAWDDLVSIITGTICSNTKSGLDVISMTCPFLLFRLWCDIWTGEMHSQQVWVISCFRYNQWQRNKNGRWCFALH